MLLASFFLYSCNATRLFAYAKIRISRDKADLASSVG